jgi:hypothetical protein
LAHTSALALIVPLGLRPLRIVCNAAALALPCQIQICKCSFDIWPIEGNQYAFKHAINPHTIPWAQQIGRIGMLERHNQWNAFDGEHV